MPGMDSGLYHGMGDGAIASLKETKHEGISTYVEKSIESMVLVLRKHIEDGELKLAGTGISQVIQITGLREMAPGEIWRRENDLGQVLRSFTDYRVCKRKTAKGQPVSGEILCESSGINEHSYFLFILTVYSTVPWGF